MDEQNETPPASDGADQLAALQAELDKARDDLAAARSAEAETVAALRDTLRAANPTLPGELIDGSSPAELAASVTRATAVRDQVLAANPPSTNGHAPKVPSGGQATPPADTSAMSAAEKIRFALSQRGS